MQHQRAGGPSGRETEVRTEAGDEVPSQRREDVQRERKEAMTRHIDDRELAALRTASLTEKEASRVRRHVESCPTCRERLDAVNVVAFARSQDRAREFANTARRLQRERNDAAETVRTL